MPSGIYTRTKEMQTGKHMLGRKLSESTLLKMSVALKGRRAPNLGQRLPEEWRRKISEGIKKAFDIKGRVLPFKKAIRNNRQWHDWRKLVFERDDYTCQMCASRSGEDGTVYLEAHHPIQVAKLLKHNLLKYIYDVRNGVTLCNPCHRTITFVKYDNA